MFDAVHNPLPHTHTCTNTHFLSKVFKYRDWDLQKMVMTNHIPAKLEWKRQLQER